MTANAAETLTDSVLVHTTISSQALHFHCSKSLVTGYHRIWEKESFYSFVPTKPGSSIRFGPHDSKRHMSPLHSFRSGTGMFSAPESISLTPQSRVPRPVLEVLHQGVHQATQAGLLQSGFFRPHCRSRMLEKGHL